jgi:hypothetical protein
MVPGNASEHGGTLLFRTSNRLLAERLSDHLAHPLYHSCVAVGQLWKFNELTSRLCEHSGWATERCATNAPRCHIKKIKLFPFATIWWLKEEEEIQSIYSNWFVVTHSPLLPPVLFLDSLDGGLILLNNVVHQVNSTQQASSTVTHAGILFPYPTTHHCSWFILYSSLIHLSSIIH